MSVSSVTEVKRSGYEASDGYHLTRTYQVTFSSGHTLTDCHFDCFSADDGSTSIPNYGSLHPQTSYARVARVEPKETNSRLIWNVEVAYDEDRDRTSSPTSEPADLRFGVRTERVVIWQDKDGNPIVNSAGQWFDPPIVKDVHYLTLAVVRNVTSYDPELAQDYMDTVNSDTVVIAGLTLSEGQARLDEWTASSEEARGISYYREQIRLSFDADWDDNILDLGTKAINADGQLSTIYEKQTASGVVYELASSGGGSGGRPVQEPVKLDGSGNIYTAGLTSAAGVFLTFESYPERDFWRLDLPTDT